jgi:hypothetical protein
MLWKRHVSRHSTTGSSRAHIEMAHAKRCRLTQILSRTDMRVLIAVTRPCRAAAFATSEEWAQELVIDMRLPIFFSRIPSVRPTILLHLTRSKQTLEAI